MTPTCTFPVLARPDLAAGCRILSGLGAGAGFCAAVESASPAEAARARIAQLRAARAGMAPLDSGGGDGGSESAIIAEPSGAGDGELVYQLNLKDSPLDILLDKYSELTGRTMIKAPGVNATFTFKAHGKLTRAEMIQAMDSLLTMNNITLVPLGTRFYRVVQTDKAPAEGMAIQRGIPETGLPESDALVSQLVGLKYLEMEDAHDHRAAHAARLRQGSAVRPHQQSAGDGDLFEPQAHLSTSSRWWTSPPRRASRRASTRSSTPRPPTSPRA
jgi:hypothetical protein